MFPLLLDTSSWISTFAEFLTSGFSWISDLFATIITFLFNFLFAIALQIIVRASAGFLYSLLLALLALVDLFEGVFNIFAGTKTVTYNNEKMYLFDLFMVEGTVQRALIFITFIGVALCFIFTIYSVMKSMGSYILENKRPVSEVLKTAMKSCIAFLMVPIMAYFGIQLSTVILTSTERAIMQSTGSDSSPKLSSIVFLAGTFNDDDPDASYTDELRAPYFYGDTDWSDASALDEFTMMPSLNIDALVNFFNNLTEEVPNDALEESDGSNKSSGTNYAIDEIETDDTYSDYMDIADVLFKDLYNYPLVYILSIGVILIMLCAIFVFIRKIIELIILYITSPIFVSTMPLDGGATFKRWRDMFIGKLFSGFGIVISMKLVMIFVPVIMSSTIKFSNVSALDVTIKIIFITGALFAAWKSNTTVLEIINPELAAADRASAAVVAGAVKMAAEKAVQAGMAAATGGGSAAAGAAAKGAAGAAGGAGGAAGGASGALGGGGNAFKGGEASGGGKMNLGDKGGKSGSEDKGGKSGSEEKGGKSGSEDKGGKSGSEDNSNKNGSNDNSGKDDSSQKINKAADTIKDMDLGSEDEDEEENKK
ncbi:MAG: Mbov_0396 family ICE element transmembrane protein [Oscillospiraceae bacterium]